MSQKASIGLDYSHNNKLTLEASSFADFTQFLFNSGYKLGKIQAGFETLSKLEPYTMIILSSPQNKKVSKEEIEVLHEYVKNGGNLLIVSSSGGDYSNKTNLNELTQKFGFEFYPDEIYDSMNYVNLQKRPFLTKFKPHIITEQIKNIVFSSACSLKILDFVQENENIKIEVLMNAGLNCWRKIWKGKEWIEEDSPKIPLLTAVEYYKGKVVGFGNLSIFSSLGREYGFSAFDNDILIANILRWLSTGIISEGKVVTVNLNLDLYYWANSVIEDKNWSNISDIINVSLKYFKDHYKEAIENIRQSLEERKKRKEKYEKEKAEEETEEDRILELVAPRRREDLDDIMSELENITGEKIELQLNIDEEEEITAEIKKELDSVEKELEKQMADELEEEIEKEEKLIMNSAREEIEKEFDRKIEDDKAEKIQDELERQIGKEIEKEKQQIRDKVRKNIEKEKDKLMEQVKVEIKKSEEKEEIDLGKLIEKAKKDLENKRKELIEKARENMEKERKRRIKEIKEREIQVMKENQEFMEGILDALDEFSGPILKTKEDKEEDEN
ncbi:MAG: Gldg family protein [Promethearchaeota archaeon]